MTPEKSARAWFIAGTDTGIGKTFATCALLHLPPAAAEKPPSA